MLTEGWDANTVTHILGVRAFGTQLLCEQVVGRGAAPRLATTPNDEGMFEPEYAEVYGVPFAFIPTAGTSPVPTPPKPVHRIRAVENRAALEDHISACDWVSVPAPDREARACIPGRLAPGALQPGGADGDRGGRHRRRGPDAQP